MAQDPTAVTELSTEECWERLRHAAFGRLAVVADGAPDIFPVNHVVDQGSLVFRTTEGTKLAAASGNRVAFEIDGRDGDLAWSVVAKGPAYEIRSLHESLEAMELGVAPWQTGSKPRFVRVEPERVTGRQFRVTGG